MRVGQKHVTAKSARKVYLMQSRFFNAMPKDMQFLSAREIYELAQKQYDSQPMSEKKRWEKYLTRKPKVKIPFSARIIMIVRRVVNFIKSAPRVDN